MEQNYKTKPKEYILEFLESHTNMRFSAKEMYEEIIKAGYSINLATVYRNLDKLVEAGSLLKHFDNDTNCATYQYIENESCLAHFHFECKKCGKMIHLGKVETERFLKMVQNTLHFAVEPQNTYLTGLCSKCSGKFVVINF